MKRSKLLEIIKEVLSEDGAMGNVTGAVGGYSTPKAFAKPGQEKNAATLESERLGMKTVKQKKYPYSTKMIDYKKLN